ncbi:cupin domain-containing protein [Dactylosporangium cerinum]|uniref:Cupin domain-containing protein n=1 Tax=Dactylosporangium cerinum TaxID=1434730 RepID=A0ABV9VZL4_9ACTN
MSEQRVDLPYPQAALVVPAATAEHVALPGGGFQLFADGSHTGGAFSANRLILGEGADGARPHQHRLSAELFFVLAGVAEFLLDDALVQVAAGGLVVVPPGLPHAFGAAAGSGADLFVVLAPGVDRFGYFRALGQIHRGLATFDALLPEQERYDVHFLPDDAWTAARAPEGS